MLKLWHLHCDLNIGKTLAHHTMSFCWLRPPWWEIESPAKIETRQTRQKQTLSISGLMAQVALELHSCTAPCTSLPGSFRYSIMFKNLKVLMKFQSGQTCWTFPVHIFYPKHRWARVWYPPSLASIVRDRNCTTNPVITRQTLTSHRWRLSSLSRHTDFNMFQHVSTYFNHLQRTSVSAAVTTRAWVGLKHVRPGLIASDSGSKSPTNRSV